MARDNYSYQKYRREQAKKKKKEEKLQRKLDKKNAQVSGDQAQTQGDNPPVSAQPVNGIENVQDNKVE